MAQKFFCDLCDAEVPKKKVRNPLRVAVPIAKNKVLNLEIRAGVSDKPGNTTPGVVCYACIRKHAAAAKKA